MLEAVSLGNPRLEGARFLPQVLTPLVNAAERGEPIAPAMQAVVRILGFDSFMYGTGIATRPKSELKSYVFTTLPREWVVRYDARGYIEVDPRIKHIFDGAMPFVWDQRSERGQDAATDAFLEDAAAQGIASGVALAVYCSSEGGHVGVAFNSSHPEIDEVRRLEIARNLGDMFLLAVYFHEFFMKNVIGRGVPPAFEGIPLTARERQCLVFGSHGFTSKEMAAELHISERTVEMYYSHIRSKLGVSNRQEAIAKAIECGLIRRDELPTSSRVMRRQIRRAR